MTSASDSKEYDGTPLTNSNVEVSGMVSSMERVLLEYKVTEARQKPEARIIPLLIALKSEQMQIIIRYQRLKEHFTVSKKQGKIIITAVSDTKQYDGTPLTANRYTKSGTLVNGDELVVTVGSITNAGSAEQSNRCENSEW